MGLWTIVHRDGGMPVVPFGGNEHRDEGMLVYFSMEAAEAAAQHQNELYDLDCVPCAIIPDLVNYWRAGR